MKTIDGDQRIANFSRDVDIDLIHYQIIVETSPNHGLYEATVAYHVETKTYKVCQYALVWPPFETWILSRP